MNATDVATDTDICGRSGCVVATVDTERDDVGAADVGDVGLVVGDLEAGQ
ncbi:hypothetical protein [Halogranum gelatinilyticum]|nr:hypothetical protein [Halogranum gelatinilyticum]